MTNWYPGDRVIFPWTEEKIGNIIEVNEDEIIVSVNGKKYKLDSSELTRIGD